MSKASPKFRAVSKIGHMAEMQNVEAAIRDDQFFA